MPQLFVLSPSMTKEGAQGRFSESFVSGVKSEMAKKYDIAGEFYLKEASIQQKKKDLHGSALCFLLAGRCKLRAKKSAQEEFEKGAVSYLELADQSKDSSPLGSRLVYRCAAKCFFRAELYDKADEAHRSANSIKQVLGTVTEIKQPVLIVDNSKVITLKLKKYVEQFGFNEVVICNSGREGLEKFGELIGNHKFPIVLLDMSMLDLNGNEVAAQMLKILPETIIALITADNINAERVKEALANGVGYFLQKPFRYDQMKELLETIQYEADVI